MTIEFIAFTPDREIVGVGPTRQDALEDGRKWCHGGLIVALASPALAEAVRAGQVTAWDYSCAKGWLPEEAPFAKEIAALKAGLAA